MPVYLVRHAKAGSRNDFAGDDRERPLTNGGRKQAAALAKRLAALSPSVIVSSPYRRCVETVEPLAVAINGEVRLDEVLGEFFTERAQPDIELMNLLRTLPDRSVVCSHGDVIPAIINALEDRGVHIHGEPQWQKASVWVLERDGQRFASASAWPPPAVE